MRRRLDRLVEDYPDSSKLLNQIDIDKTYSILSATLKVIKGISYGFDGAADDKAIKLYIVLSEETEKNSVAL